MSTITVDLPEPVLVAITERAKSQGFENVNAFISELVLRISARQAEIEDLALEGLKSGPSQPWDKSEIDEIRKNLKSKHGG